MVQVGQRRLAYWEAGAAYMPYSQGYFPAEATAAAAVTWAYGGAFSSGAGDPTPGGIGDFGFNADWGGGFDGGGGDAG